MYPFLFWSSPKEPREPNSCVNTLYIGQLSLCTYDMLFSSQQERYLPSTPQIPGSDSWQRNTRGASAGLDLSLQAKEHQREALWSVLMTASRLHYSEKISDSQSLSESYITHLIVRQKPTPVTQRQDVCYITTSYELDSIILIFFLIHAPHGSREPADRSGAYLKARSHRESCKKRLHLLYLFSFFQCIKIPSHSNSCGTCPWAPVKLWM